MTETTEQQHVGNGLLPADPAGLRLSLSVETWPARLAGRAAEEWTLLARYERPRPGQLSSRTAFGADLAHVGIVSMRRVPLLRGVIAPDVFEDLVGVVGEPALDQAVLTAVAEQVFTRRGGEHRLVPGVREVLGRGPRADLGDLLLVDNFSVSTDWAVQDLDLLLLGEALARAAAVTGACFAATAPSCLRASQGSRQVLSVLNRAGFRTLAGHVMVAAATELPRMAGPGWLAPAWRYRTAL
ncbi:hypothetical protein ACWDRR_25920 [Kitasatospora sp. NPDC003701]